MIPLIYFLIGGLGLGAACWFSVKGGMSGDHAGSIITVGFIWMCLCVFGAYHFS